MESKNVITAGGSMTVAHKHLTADLGAEPITNDIVAQANFTNKTVTLRFSQRLNIA